MGGDLRNLSWGRGGRLNNPVIDFQAFCRADDEVFQQISYFRLVRYLSLEFQELSVQNITDGSFVFLDDVFGLQQLDLPVDP